MTAAETTSKVRPEKVEEVARIKESFGRAIATVVVDFRGLTVEQTTELRARFREKAIEYRVVKNTLVNKALADSEIGKSDDFKASLKGPTGIAWSYEDPSTAAKIIKEFRKEDPKNEEFLQVKCGYMEGQFFDGAAVENQLAALPGKDEVRAMLLAQLMAPAQSLVRQLGAPAQNFAYVLDAKTRVGGE